MPDAPPACDLFCTRQPSPALSDTPEIGEGGCYAVVALHPVFAALDVFLSTPYEAWEGAGGRKVG